MDCYFTPFEAMQDVSMPLSNPSIFVPQGSSRQTALRFASSGRASCPFDNSTLVRCSCSQQPLPRMAPNLADSRYDVK
jgi:hypothetical protein